MIKPTLLGGLLLALHTSLAIGQATTAPTDSWQTIFFDNPGTALPLLTAAAIQHSSQLKSLEIDKSIGQQNIAIARKNILGSVAPVATYTYGNLASIGRADPNDPNQFATSNSSRYSAGVSLSLPIDRIANRGNLIKKEELAYQRAESLRQDREDLLRQQIIQLYQNVVLARKVFGLQQEAFVTVQTNYRLVEKQFRQGQLLLPAMSEASSQLTSASIAQETARNEYDTAFMLLEAVVGTRISTLMTKNR